MSSSAAIASITAVLGKLLETGVKLDDEGNPDLDLTDLDVSTQPPGKARNNKTSNQINIFLYQALPNPALRNMDLPRKVRQGETGVPPLALNLNYLITAYGKDDDDKLSHRILGRAMRVLNDYPLVGISDLFNSPDITDLLAGSGVALQPENIRITPLPLTLDELSKLWMMFQTDYRISTAYQVSVVLIESARPAQSSLPVLKRGSGDTGASVGASPLPVLLSAAPSGPMPGVVPGTDLEISGKHMDVTGIKVRFSNIRLDEPIELDPLPGIRPDSIAVHVPDISEDPEAYRIWMPGFYSVALAIRDPPRPVLVTNEVPMALAPSITISPGSAPAGDVTITVTCIPRIRDGQPAVLLFGDSQIRELDRNSPADGSEPTTLTFLVKDARPGSYVIRLRVDGADSQPFIVTGTPPTMDFDPAMRVTIT